MNQNLKTAIIIGVILLVLLIAAPLAWGGWRGDGWGMMGSGMMGWGLLAAVFMVLFWVLVIWAVVALVRGLSQSGGSDSSRAESALEVLKKRYARGEISKEEYEERKKDLA